MSGEPSSGASAATDTPAEIMEATYRALCEHGYAELTMQDIADESDKSKAALHYHYDTKDELLLSFLEYLFDSFVEKYGDPGGENAVERLVRFVDGILCRSDVKSDEAIQTAFLEIKAQAPYNAAYREQLDAVDRFVRGRVEDIVREGIAEGVIDESVDPEDTAAFVATLIDGVNTRRISIGETQGGTRRTFVAYVRDHVVADGADVEVDPAGSDAEVDDADGAVDPTGPDIEADGEADPTTSDAEASERDETDHETEANP